MTLLNPDGSVHRVKVSEAVTQGLLPNALVGHYLSLLLGFYEAAGLPMEKLRFRILAEEDRAFYSKAAFDLEVELSVGWLELVACNYRGDYDLGRHAAVSGTNFTVDDEGEKVLPHVFELSMGIDRTLYAVLETSMRAEGERRWLALRPYVAPFHAGVFPLVNKDGLEEEALRITDELRETMDVFYDRTGSIGKRYARADDIGVPFCMTVDYQTLSDKTVTLRSRDNRSQERVPVAELGSRLAALCAYPRLSA